MEETKICRHCGEEKSLDDFPTNVEIAEILVGENQKKSRRTKSKKVTKNQILFCHFIQK